MDFSHQKKKKTVDFYLTDVDSLWTHMKHADKQIKLKRRWLMGLPTSKDEDQQIQWPAFLQNRYLPESLLREDDVFYETSKTSVKKAFGTLSLEKENHSFQESVRDVDIPCLSKELSSRLDDISNTGLHLLAMHLTKVQNVHNKTRWKLKNIVQKYLRRMQKCEGDHHLEECVRLSQVVTNPCFFGKGKTFSSSSSYQSPSTKVQWVLGNLKNFPSQVLLSMHRKLKGESGKMIHFEIHRSGWNRNRLINRVKKICECRLAELEEGDELPGSILKAMAVTTLSMNLNPGIQNQNLADFYQFSPDIVALQNNITKAIWLINEKVMVSELRELQLLLGLNTNLPIKSLRSTIRKLLTVYLFECDDMDLIPKSLLDALSMINRSSRNVPQRYSLKDDIDEDVECMLDISAQAKQIILDFLPDHNYDQEFTDAYMEDLQESSESDESDTDDALLFGFERSPDNIFRINDSAELAESIGDSIFIEKNVSDIGPSISGSNTSIKMGVVTDHTGVTPGFLCANSKAKNTAIDANVDKEVDPTEQSDSDNKYLCIQEACDETSLFAYKCIGHLLKECARIQGSNLDPVDSSYLRGGHSVTERSPDAATQKQGDDVGGMFICQVVEELLPSISNSVKEKLEEMMSLL
ncbi:unnamed protein product [Rhodiola kirilowii]